MRVRPFVSVTQSVKFVLTCASKFARSDSVSSPPSASPEVNCNVPSGSSTGVPRCCGTSTVNTALLLVTLPARLVTMTEYVPEFVRVAFGNESSAAVPAAKFVPSLFHW